MPGLGWLGGLSRPQSDRVNLTPSLTQVGDPTFAGFCAARGAEVGARVCAKVSAEERMGVFALRGQPAAMQVECSLSRQPPPLCIYSSEPKAPSEWGWCRRCAFAVAVCTVGVGPVP